MPLATRGDVQIQWEEQGAGDPLLLVMGHAWPRQMWFRQAPVLSENFRVITFDNRGVGDTTTTAEHWTIEDMAADAVAVLDAAEVTRAHVYGVSMGGGIAQAIALNHHDRVGAVILGCTASHAAKSSVRRRTVLWHVIPALVRGKRAAAIAAGRVIAYGPGTDIQRIGEDADVLLSVKSSRAGARAQREAILSYSASPARLSELRMPVLVLHGDADKLVPLHYGEELTRLIPHAEFVVFPGAGHVYPTDATAQANEVVRDFLLAHPLPSN